MTSCSSPKVWPLLRAAFPRRRSWHGRPVDARKGSFVGFEIGRVADVAIKRLGVGPYEAMGAGFFASLAAFGAVAKIWNAGDFNRTPLRTRSLY